MPLPLPIRILLLPLSWMYGCAALLRAFFYRKGIFQRRKLKTPVVSVGNLSVGGTGKTPMVLWLAERFLAEGRRVAILSRGYRGGEGSSDEVALLRRRLGDRVLFGIGPNRFANGRKIESENTVDVFLLDDGFQHLKLMRDVDILLIDSTQALHKDALLPAGTLREPLSAVSRAGIVLFTRVHQAPFAVPAIARFPALPIFPASTQLVRIRKVADDSEGIPAHEPILAFCGIGNPEAFFQDLARWGVSITCKKQFRDHHRYSEADVRALETLAERSRAKGFLTTEKDVQNLGSAKFSLPLYCCEIAMEIPDEEEFWKLILRSLPQQAGAPA